MSKVLTIREELTKLLQPIATRLSNNKTFDLFLLECIKDDKLMLVTNTIRETPNYGFFVTHIFREDGVLAIINSSFLTEEERQSIEGMIDIVNHKLVKEVGIESTAIFFDRKDVLCTLLDLLADPLVNKYPDTKNLLTTLI